MDAVNVSWHPIADRTPRCHGHGERHHGRGGISLLRFLALRIGGCGVARAGIWPSAPIECTVEGCDHDGERSDAEHLAYELHDGDVGSVRSHGGGHDGRVVDAPWHSAHEGGAQVHARYGAHGESQDEVEREEGAQHEEKGSHGTAHAQKVAPLKGASDEGAGHNLHARANLCGEPCDSCGDAQSRHTDEGPDHVSRRDLDPLGEKSARAAHSDREQRRKPSVLDKRLHVILCSLCTGSMLSLRIIMNFTHDTVRACEDKPSSCQFAPIDTSE